MFSKDLISELSKIPTPFYFYDDRLLDETLSYLKKLADYYGYHVHYALKANANDRILHKISEYGFGADCVSGNEVLKAVSTGFSNDKIVFAGVGKSDKEIINAIDNDIFSFNCESEQEIEVINKIAEAKDKKVSIALRINPDIDAHTHEYITTGLNENKFGINIPDIDKIIEKIKVLGNIVLTGLHFHVGSQISDMEVYRKLCLRVNEIVDNIENKGVKIKVLNLGGGLGIDYDEPDSNRIPDFKGLFEVVNKNLKVKDYQEVHFELGRSVVGQCGTLFTKVLYIKRGVKKNFVIVDAGFTELLRPALYKAFHKIENLTAKMQDAEIYDVVGPICESADFFVKDYEMPVTQRGDLLAIRSTGAYGEVMSSGYNLRDKAKAYYISDIEKRN